MVGTSGIDWQPLADYLFAEIGYAIGEQKFYLLDRALQPIMQAGGIADVHQLVGRLGSDRAMRQQVINAVTINESLFFRDIHLWDDLLGRALPLLIEEVGFKRRLDILQCACATGQELYTLAMLLREQPEAVRGLPVHITATDIDTDALDRARAGEYSTFELSRGINDARRARWFEEIAPQRWRVKPGLLPSVEFRHMNLREPFRFSQRFDLVLCRNVLIYFDVPGKAAVLDRLATLTNNYGFLALGGTESMLGVTQTWRMRRLGNTTFYQKAF